jgi:hypothetical protein
MGRIDILITSAALSREDLQAAYNCDAMQAEMKSGDISLFSTVRTVQG